MGYGIYISSTSFSIIKLNRENWDIDYDLFKNTIRNSIRMNLTHIKGQKNALLFSGGKDSAMLAIMLNKEFDIPILLYSAEYSNPAGFSLNEKDSERSKWYSDWLGIPLTKININCDKLVFDDIKYLIPRMPFSSHPACVFEFLIKKIESDTDNVVVWTGQNADTVYGMDHQIIRNVGSENIKRIFPYSTVSSMLMFRNINFNFSDMIIPKKYISRYLREMLGTKIYNTLYPTSLWTGNNDIVLDFERKIIYGTNYGTSLRSYVGTEQVSSMQQCK